MQLTVVPDYSGAISQIGQDIFSCSAMGNLSLLDLKIFHKVSNIEYIINWKGFDKCLLVYVKIILGNIIWSFLCLSMLIIIRRFATVSLDGPASGQLCRCGRYKRLARATRQGIQGTEGRRELHNRLFLSVYHGTEKHGQEISILIWSSILLHRNNCFKKICIHTKKDCSNDTPERALAQQNRCWPRVYIGVGKFASCASTDTTKTAKIILTLQWQKN